MANCAACSAPLQEGVRFCPACGASIAASPAWDVGGQQTVGPEDVAGRRLANGQVFAGRYEIEAPVGEGGMGAVYRARDRVSGDVIALKVIRPDRSWTSAAMQQLVREGAVARRIRHPNVVSVYDVSEADGAPFISMELLEGQSLRAWSRQRIAAQRDCPFAKAAQIMIAICDGLMAAHAMGVIHRDLKPENVFLLGDPEAGPPRLKILDFGLARLSASNTGSTGSSSGGTPLYMAPEQRTSPDAVTAAADIYSLSVMFYELLVDVALHGVWQPPSSGRSDVPAEIDALILEGASGRPRSRPQSVEDFRQRIIAASLPAQSARDAAPKAEAAAARRTASPKASPSLATPRPPKPARKEAAGGWSARTGLIAALFPKDEPLRQGDAASVALRKPRWTELFIPVGRIGRTAFILRSAVVGVTAWFLPSVTQAIYGVRVDAAHITIVLVAKALAVGLLIVAMVTAALRLHDMRLSGWLAVPMAAASLAGLLFAPWLGFVIALAFAPWLATARGDALQNRYGVTTTR